MKKALFAVVFSFACLAPAQESQNRNASSLQGLNIKGPLTCADSQVLTWIAANNRFECGASGGGGGGSASFSAITPGTNTGALFIGSGGALSATGSGAITATAITASGVTAATYGDATHVPQIAINSQGRITSAGNTGITGTGGAGTPPYSTTTITASPMSILASTHSQGQYAFPMCWDTATPRQLLSCTWTRASNGDLALSYSSAPGEIEVYGATGGFANPMTTSGDLITGGTSGAAGRLAKGNNGQVLTMVSGAVVWAAASGGGGTIATTTSLLKGDNAGNAVAATAGTDYLGGVANFTHDGCVAIQLSNGVLTCQTTLSYAGSVLTVTGQVSATSSIVSAGDLKVAAGGDIYFNGRSHFESPSDGVTLMINNAGTDFGRLQFGGTTSSFPAIKRSTTGLLFRLADDSGYTTVDASGYKAGGAVGVTGSGTCTITAIAGGIITAASCI